MTHKSAFTTGPFLSASHAVEDFAVGIYFSYLLEEAVMEQMLLEKKLEEAIDAEDEDKIEQLKMDLSLIEGAYQLSSFVESENSH